MDTLNEILTDLVSGQDADNLISTNVESKLSDIGKELAKYKKKYKHAKKGGAKRKKLKKQIKRLKKERDGYQRSIQLLLLRQSSAPGRWDKLLEISAPKVLDLVGLVIDRKFKNNPPRIIYPAPKSAGRPLQYRPPYRLPPPQDYGDIYGEG